MGYDLIYTAVSSDLNSKKLFDHRTCGQCAWSRFMFKYNIWKSELFYLRVIKLWALTLITWQYLSSCDFLIKIVSVLSIQQSSLHFFLCTTPLSNAL